MRVGIVGAGPIGSIAAAYLAKAGQEVHVADVWREQIEALAVAGIHVEGALETHQHIAGGHAQAADLAVVEPDFLVVAVKACVLRSLLKELAKAVTPRTVIVSMQNGLDTEEVLAHAFDQNTILRFVVNFAGKVLEPGRVRATFFHPPNHLGCACRKEGCDNAHELAGLFTAAGLPTAPQRDIKRYSWEKTILNSALSPVSAVTGMTMREVMGAPDTRQIVEKILAEAIRVAARVGYDFGPGFFEHCIEYLDGGGPHKPSMLMDVEAKRETEIAFLNGRIAYYGDLHGCPAPHSELITHLVKAVEYRYMPAKAGAV